MPCNDGSLHHSQSYAPLRSRGALAPIKQSGSGVLLELVSVQPKRYVRRKSCSTSRKGKAVLAGWTALTHPARLLTGYLIDRLSWKGVTGMQAVILIAIPPCSRLYIIIHSIQL